MNGLDGGVGGGQVSKRVTGGYSMGKLLIENSHTPCAQRGYSREAVNRIIQQLIGVGWSVRAGHWRHVSTPGKRSKSEPQRDITPVRQPSEIGRVESSNLHNSKTSTYASAERAESRKSGKEMTRQAKRKLVTLTMDVMTTAGLAGIFMHLATKSNLLLWIDPTGWEYNPRPPLYYMNNIP